MVGVQVGHDDQLDIVGVDAADGELGTQRLLGLHPQLREAERDHSPKALLRSPRRYRGMQASVDQERPSTGVLEEKGNDRDVEHLAGRHPEAESAGRAEQPGRTEEPAWGTLELPAEKRVKPDRRAGTPARKW